MGRRGPAPKPTATKRLEGNPGKRKLNQNEPKPRSRRPKMPDYFSQDQEAVWRRVTRELRAMQVMTSADADVITLLVEAIVERREAQVIVAKDGATIMSPNGYPTVHPLSGKVNKLGAQILRLLEQLGMTPASRSRIQTLDDKSDDPFEEFLKRKPSSG